MCACVCVCVRACVRVCVPILAFILLCLSRYSRRQQKLPSPDFVQQRDPLTNTSNNNNRVQLYLCPK